VQRIVIVSDQVPAPSGHAGAGGLAVALSAALQETGGLWSHRENGARQRESKRWKTPADPNKRVHPHAIAEQ
jgi:hypothetical protein